MSNEKLISASDLITVIRDDPYIPGRAFARVSDHIDDAPAVDAVEVVHAHWEDVWGGKYANKKYRCSACRGKALYDTKQDSLGNWSAEQELTPICPHCGAKMDGGNEDG